MEDGMGDLFDYIDDLLDDDDVMALVEHCDDAAAALLLPPLPLVPVAAPVTAADGGLDSLDCSGDHNAELDVVQLEWMPKFLYDSDAFSLDLPSCDAIANDADDNGSQTKARGDSFVSALGANATGGGDTPASSSSCSTSASYFGGGNSARAMLPPVGPPELPPVIPTRARSKRQRRSTLMPQPPSSDVVAAPHPLSVASDSDPESFGESCPPPPPPKKKKKKSKKKGPGATAAAEGNEPGSPPPGRKCTHCEIQKTPQWRAGPMGPKTLCNACGVRYRSGRLFPEYRPAGSPTFVSSLHSNSHKKVVEMRNKASHSAAAPGASAPSSDGCDLLGYMRRKE
ncbi:GATA transcription factor 8-like [Musa acuminata AAA Group]|uniref:GATA transcription factor 8-like n=1 Tax=Musa acuminata AAA Group TaxID=214697 RepID=UPI0031D63DF1